MVVVHDMVREIPRTLRTLSPAHQRGIDGDDYEVIVVDNGSAHPIAPEVVAAHPGHLRVIRLDPAPPSPARAANEGVAAAQGDLVGVIVDGARMVSPGLLATARLGARLAERPVVTAPAWHLGPVRHMQAAEAGYDQATEDELLRTTGWEDDGYALFDVATLAASSSRGWFGPMGESSSLFLPAALWAELGGLDERFDLPGGGLVNHDLYHRACSVPDAQLVVMLGEGTFHQIHGGAATGNRYGWAEMDAQFASLRGHPYTPPQVPALYVGTLPRQVLPEIERSAGKAIARAGRPTASDRPAPA